MSLKSMMLVGVVAFVATAYLPDVITRQNRQKTRSVVEAVGKTGVAAFQAFAGSVKDHYTEPVVSPEPIEVQTKAMVQVSEFLAKMPETVSQEVAKANAKQMEDVNRRLVQQDEAIAKVAEISQAAVTTLAKVAERLDKLDSTIQELKSDKSKGVTPRGDQGQSVTVPSVPAVPLVLREAANP
jgi:hypothetical protein